MTSSSDHEIIAAVARAALGDDWDEKLYPSVREEWLDYFRKAHRFITAHAEEAVLRKMLDPSDAMRAAGVNAPLPAHIGDLPLYEKIWRSMLVAGAKELGIDLTEGDANGN